MLRGMLITCIMVSIVHAESLGDYDWSDGNFESEEEIEWYFFSGELRLEKFVTSITVDAEFGYCKRLTTADLDQDGHLDLVAVGYEGELSWWQNPWPDIEPWQKYMITDSLSGGIWVSCGDVDNDGDIDIVSASRIADTITFWEHIQYKPSWSPHTVTNDFDMVSEAILCDMDDDGDLDVIGASFGQHTVKWFEFVGTAQSWPEQLISETLNGASSVIGTDVNNDGAIDVIVSAAVDDQLFWFEYDEPVSSWIPHTISNEANMVRVMYAADLDGDSEVDLAACSIEDDLLYWLENNGTSIWQITEIDSLLSIPGFIGVSDFNDDGHSDIICAYGGLGGVSVWTGDGTGTTWDHVVLCKGLPFMSGAACISDPDLDGVSEPVVLFANNAGICWWEAEYDDFCDTGSLQSQLFEIPYPTTQASYMWYDLVWEADVPSGTCVAFQVRVGQTPTSMDPWSDTIWVSETPLGPLLSDTAYYYQYKAILGTTDTGITPRLFNVEAYLEIFGGIETSTAPLQEPLTITPNPSYGTVVIDYLPLQTGQTSDISIFDITGRLHHKSEFTPQTSRPQQIVLKLTPGIYFCRLREGDICRIERFAVIE